MVRAPWLVSLLIATASWADNSIVTYPTGSTTAPLPFVEYLPPNYTGGTSSERLVIMFHGLGESGAGTNATELYNALTGYGPMGRIRSALANGGTPMFANTHRAIVLAPRNPSGFWDLNLAAQFLDWAQTQYRVDPEHIYLTGISAGGGPTWMVVTMRPNIVAAVLPICPVINTGSPNATAFVGVDVWAFHGFGDPQVPRAESIAWVNAVGRSVSGSTSFPGVMTGYPHQNGDTSMAASTDQTAVYTPTGYVWQQGIIATSGAPAKYTMLAVASHFIWDGIYSNAAVWDWLFAQRKSDGVADAGTVGPDAGMVDSGVVDAGSADAGQADAGVVDAGEADGGKPDAAETDGGELADAGFEKNDESSGRAGDISGGCGCGTTSTNSLVAIAFVSAFLAARRHRRACARSLQQRD